MKNKNWIETNCEFILANGCWVASSRKITDTLYDDAQATQATAYTILKMPIETFKRRRRCRVNAKLRNCQIISFIIRATSVCEWVCGCVRAQERDVHEQTNMRLNVLQFARREYRVAEKEVRRFVDVVRVFHMFLFSVYLGFLGCVCACVWLFVRRRYRYVQNIVIRTEYVEIPSHTDAFELITEIVQ